MEDNGILWGALESNFEYDYMMGGSDVPTPLYTFKDKKVMYNQKWNDTYGCTWYAVMTCIANNWDIDWTDEDFKYLRDAAPSYWWQWPPWMYLSRAWDMVVDYLNTKYPDQKRVKLSVSLSDAMGYLGKWYCVQFGSTVNLQYRYDLDDGKISAPWWSGGYGHCRSFTAIQTRDSIIENYNWVYPHNLIDLRSLKELIESKQLFPQAFIYYPTTDMPEINVPHMTVEQADKLEKLHPDMFTSNLSESVRAWIDAAGKGMKLHYTTYLWVDGVMKMMNDLLIYRS